MKLLFFTRLLGAAAVTVALAGCGGGSDPVATSSPPPPPPPPPPINVAAVLAQLEGSGAIPKLDRTTSLSGPDSNGNGVRDDIDAYIQSKFTNLTQRQAAAQTAKALQSTLTVDAANKDATTAVSQSMTNATHCLYSRFADVQGANSPGAVSRDLEAMTANTKARLKAYLAYNSARDGTTSSLPKGDTCE